jgi:hypothetical protein
MKTAVEWLVEELTKQNMFMDLFKEEINKAKQMEKEQIMDAYKRGYKRDSFTPNFREQEELFDEYYKETFKSE